MTNKQKNYRARSFIFGVLSLAVLALGIGNTVTGGSIFMSICYYFIAILNGYVAFSAFKDSRKLTES